MKTYIGTKVINAEPMSKKSFDKKIKGEHDDSSTDMAGYMVIYEDGYKSWSPKETFERAYREVTPEEKALIGETK